jgi:hypothetical protein
MVRRDIKTAKEFFMKTKRFFSFGLLAVMLVYGLVLAGCDTSDEPSDEGLGVKLPAITEETTGRNGITGSNIALEAGREVTQTFVNSLTYPGETNQNGVTWSVTNGKLSFSFGTPNQTDPLDAEMVDLEDWTNVQVSPPDAKAYLVDDFYFRIEGTNGNSGNGYYIERYKNETDDATYYRRSKIIYLYVSKDVTLSAQSGQDEHSTYTAFNLSLKAGWNLLQEDRYATPNSQTLSISIATKNVPWMVND